MIRLPSQTSFGYETIQLCCSALANEWLQRWIEHVQTLGPHRLHISTENVGFATPKEMGVTIMRTATKQVFRGKEVRRRASNLHEHVRIKRYARQRTYWCTKLEVHCSFQCLLESLTAVMPSTSPPSGTLSGYVKR